MDEFDGDDVIFPGASGPVQTGVGQVPVGVPWRLHPAQQHGGGQVGEQQKQQTELEMH